MTYVVKNAMSKTEENGLARKIMNLRCKLGLIHEWFVARIAARFFLANHGVNGKAIFQLLIIR